MPESLVIYTETLNKAKQWEADQAYSFQVTMGKDNKSWPGMVPACHVRPDPILYGLLAMGSGTPTPYGFGIKNFPKNASKEVTEVFLDNPESTRANWITRKDLDAKAGSLILLNTNNSLAVHSRLVNFLKKLPDPVDGDTSRQRIIFWFD